VPESRMYQLMIVAKRHESQTKPPDDSCTTCRPTTLGGHLAVL
jgi:hypothetical protein